MENKLLVGGSAIAVVVLVLASLSPVVGYNSVESSVKDSPLFSIRTKRAIDEESHTFTSDYIGKGEEINILIPARNSKAILVQRMIDIIRTMNEEEFNKFISLAIYHFDKSHDVDIQEIITTLYQIRNNQVEIEKDITDGEGNRLATEGCPIPTMEFKLECWRTWLQLFLMFTGLMLLGFLFWLDDKIPTFIECYTYINC